MAGKLPKPEYLVSISEKFGVNIDWLLTGNGDPYIYKVSENNAEVHRVAAPDREYNLHGGWEPRPEMLDEDHMMLGKAFEIIRSKSVYRTALVANINAFFGALMAEKELADTKKELADTKKTVESQGILMKKLEERIAAIERKDRAAGE